MLLPATREPRSCKRDLEMPVATSFTVPSHTLTRLLGWAPESSRNRFVRKGICFGVSEVSYRNGCIQPRENRTLML